MTGVATSFMHNLHTKNGENEFAEMEYINITVVTSNKPYGISDGSNSFFDGHDVPKFKLTKNGVHSGHVQTGIQDPFCLQIKGRCKVIPKAAYCVILVSLINLKEKLKYIDSYVNFICWLITTPVVVTFFSTT